MAEVKIGIEGLYKIFGPRAQSVMEDVRGGMSKQELLERHDHVLGLKDINVDVAPGRFPSSWGCPDRASPP